MDDADTPVRPRNRSANVALPFSMYKSQRAAERKFAAWEPKTSAEAAARWKELQSSPDDLSMLQMYKRAGIEPIKLAK